MPNYTLEYQLRIRNASTVSNPNGTADALTITSVAGGTNPYIAAAPNGDGQEIDPVTGQTRTGSYVVEVVDVATSTDSTGTVRVVTSQLEDAGFLQQLLGRRAYVEVRRDGGAWSSLIAGYVLAVRLVSPVRYAITIGDTRRVEQTQPIFTGNVLGSFTTRGTLTGGPVTADFGFVKARGGWTYKIYRVGVTDDWFAEFQSGYASYGGSPITRDFRTLVNPTVVNTIAGRATFNPNSISLFGSSFSQYVTLFDGITVWVNGSATTAKLCGYSEAQTNETLGYNRLYFYWPGATVSNGDTVQISLATTEVSQLCPLYLDAHPVDIVTAIWTAARIQYDPAGAWIATARAAIGANVRLALRLTEAPKIADFLENAICGPFGLAVRTSTASGSEGNQELVVTRVGTTAAPSLTIAAADLVSADPVVFDLDERTAINTITLTQQILSPANNQGGPNPSQNLPPDGVLANTVTITGRYTDSNLTTFAARDITYTVPGMIHTAADFTPSPADTLASIATNILPRFGRGSPVAEVQVLATAASAAVQVGDEIFVGAPHYPNRNYRIGESTGLGNRIMQVVRRTETPIGPHLRLIDSGINAQPVSPAATITIAASTANPYAIARFTITNAATINSGGVLGVEVEWGTGATPTSNGIVNRYLPGAVPTGAVDLPAVTGSGVQVQVRARTTQTGRRPSAWTAWQSVTLTAIPTPGAITVGTTTATSVAISWTNTSTVFPLFVYAYLGGSAPANWAPFLVTTLPPGSTSTVIRTLEAGTYQLALAYSTPTGPGPVRTASVTTSGAGTTATRPAGLAIIPLLDDATLPQGIALGLYPSDQTLDFVIERSTTSGSGFAELARVPGSTEVYVDRLPRDGTTYYYRAKSALGGFVTSAATGEVSAVARGVPTEVVRPAPIAPIVQVIVSETATTGTVELTITDPQGRLTQVRFRHRTNAGAWSAWTVDTSVPYSYTQSLPSSGFLDIEYEVSGYAVDGIERVIAGGVESFDKGTAASFVSVVGTFDSAGTFTLAASADSDTASMKFALSSGSQPNLATTQAASPVNGRTYTTSIAGAYASGTTLFVSALAYTQAGGTGTESALYEYRFVRDGAIIYTECRITPQASSATQITVVVTATATTGTPTVQLVAITGSATLASGAGIGSAVPSGSSWTFNRGAALGQPGGAIFRSVLAGAQSDDDLIEIPEQGRDTTYLTTRARVTSTSPTQVVVRVAVLDKYTALSASIAYSTTGVGTVSPASPQSVTCAVGDTFPAEVVGQYVDFTVDRPAVGAGTGRIVFTASATGRVADADSVDIPAQDVGALAISCAFNDAGTQATLAFTADTTVASFKFATSTSSFPSLGTVQAASAVNARNSTQTVSGTFTLGTVLYVSAVTYSGASGTGRESAIFQLAFRRQNTAPTVLNRQPGNAVCYPARVDDEFTREVGHYVPGPQTGTQAGKHYGQVIVPRGVTLRAVRCNCYALQAPTGGNPGDTISLNFYRQTDNGGTTFLGSTQQNLYAGWQTLGVTSLSEDTTNRSYFIYFEVTWNTAPPSSSDLEIAWIEAEYDKPNTDANV